MDSLLANYASSDDEDEQPEGGTLRPSFRPPNSAPPPLPEPFSASNRGQSESKASPFGSLPPPKASSSLFTSLPHPKSSSSLFTSLPPPKTSSSLPPLKSSSSSLFTSLPPPKTSKSSSSGPAPKKVIQFRPPIDPNLLKPGFDDDDDDEDERQSKIPRKKEADSSSNISSFSNLSALLPPPKQSLGTSSFSRRSVIETDRSENRVEERASSNAEASLNADVPLQDSYPEHGVEYPNWGYGGDACGMDGDAGGMSGDVTQYQGNYGEYGTQQYWDGNSGYGNWADGSSSVGDQSESLVASINEIERKRGRNEIPANVIEVKQDQLMSNRPRQDQVKLTGIAFGPSHQPVSSGLKPSKLHRRKHQIQSLYYDMKQKETELAERRAKGLLTKAQTQAKYGW
ncbi:hypothetical protein EJ110_NYTH07104 [Nymphaea thermarum]|nr:hypothetical protein EJ110_NYTH07104 [Nymphaea thermarum]